MNYNIMEIIDKEMRDGILAHYEGNEKEILNKQIDYMNKFITDNILRYKHSQDFRKATDLLLTDILNGKMLGR